MRLVDDPWPTPEERYYGKTRKEKIMGCSHRPPLRMHDTEASTSTAPSPLSPTSDITSTSTTPPPPHASTSMLAPAPASSF